MINFYIAMIIIIENPSNYGYSKNNLQYNKFLYSYDHSYSKS